METNLPISFELIHFVNPILIGIYISPLLNVGFALSFVLTQPLNALKASSLPVPIGWWFVRMKVEESDFCAFFWMSELNWSFGCAKELSTSSQVSSVCKHRQVFTPKQMGWCLMKRNHKYFVDHLEKNVKKLLGRKDLLVWKARKIYFLNQLGRWDPTEHFTGEISAFVFKVWTVLTGWNVAGLYWEKQSFVLTCTNQDFTTFESNMMTVVGLLV